MAKHGMICAPQPEAVEAGALALMNGGNAIDAAIACAFVQGVVDPLMCGIAGFGSCQVYMPARGVHAFVDFHGRAPHRARPDMWQHLIEGETREGFGFLLEGHVNDVGYQSITTPGSLKAYHEVHSRFGALPWRRVIEPAIAWAADGFAVSPDVYHYWMSVDPFGRVSVVDRLRFSTGSRALYLDADGNPKPIGTLIRNPDYARTLERIAAEGADVFYTGGIARTIAADMAANGALLDGDDLAAYRTTPAEPLVGTYRGHALATDRPPGGGVMLLEMLDILENFDLAALGHNTPEMIRVVAEAMKVATADKDAHVGDPGFVDVPLDRLLDKGYARARAEDIRAGVKARVPRLTSAESPHTTHVSVIDRDGNAVSMTHSLGMMSGVVTDGLGFMYNGCMGVFDPRPGRAGSIAPGKARFSSICPTIVFRDGAPVLVIGAPGGTQIAMGVLQVILNVIDFAMPIGEAVLAPRFSATSDAIDVTARIPRFVSDRVATLGYEIVRSPLSYAIAGVHAIMIDGETLTGGADPAFGGGMALLV
ncbi:MAG: gamma-glutamyltransferase [Alphaproteobacteria bacterium]